MKYKFGEFTTEVFFSGEIPCIEKITSEIDRVLVVCDENTSYIADKICGSHNTPRCLLKSGEDSKTWDSVQAILSSAHSAGLGRDGIFIGVGGGVIGDLTGFASSVYMRGCRLILVSTTLLAMVDASTGGKTGFDLFGRKNLAGSFYPAERVYIPIDCLSTLPPKEIKSGMAELIKTAVLDSDDFHDELAEIANPAFFETINPAESSGLRKCIERAVMYKGRIVSEDPKETGSARMLLNLGHTFAHALEAAAGLGKISHGEAVAWGTVRACELGYAMGITPRERAEKIKNLIASFGYECAAPHPLVNNTDLILNAMNSDKKKKSGRLRFIVPDEISARSVIIETEKEMKTVVQVINGAAF